MSSSLVTFNRYVATFQNLLKHNNVYKPTDIPRLRNL